MKKRDLVFVIFVIMLSLCFGNNTETKKYQFLNGKISVYLPGEWEMLEVVQQAGMGRVMMKIPYDRLDFAHLSFTSTFVYKSLKSDISIDELVKRVNSIGYKSLKMIKEYNHSKSAKTVIWTIEFENIRYVMYNYFAAENGVMLQYSITFPAMDESNEWLSYINEKYNEICGGITVDGKGRFTKITDFPKLTD